MAEHPELDAVTGSGEFFDLPAWARGPVSGTYLGSYYVLAHLALGHTTLWGSSMAIRRSSWLAVRTLVGRDDPEVHDDLDLAFALGPGRRIHFDPALRVGVSAPLVAGPRAARASVRPGVADAAAQLAGGAALVPLAGAPRAVSRGHPVQAGGDVRGEASGGDGPPPGRGDADQGLALKPHRGAVLVPVRMLAGDAPVVVHEGVLGLRHVQHLGGPRPPGPRRRRSRRTGRRR